MPPVRRPFGHQSPEGKAGQSETDRDAFVYPHTNLENLCDSKNLLLFLNSRGRHSPEAFAHADLVRSRLDVLKAFDPSASPSKHAMLLYGQYTLETYGKMVERDDEDQAFEQPDFSTGKDVIQIQLRIMKFLVECCKLILSDLPPESLTAETVPIQAEPEPLAMDHQPRLAWLHGSIEAWYSLPGRHDFRRLQALIAAKRSACADAIWALREDPGFFLDAVQEMDDHRAERLPDTNGKTHPAANTPSYWDSVAKSAVTHFLQPWFHWSNLFDEAEALQQCEERYQAQADRSTIPEDYARQLQHFQKRLEWLAEVTISEIQTAFQASPPMRSLFVRQPHKPGKETRVVSKSSSTKHKLLWAFHLLFDEDKRSMFEIPNVMDELERILQHEPAQRDLLSPMMAGYVSELSLLSEGLRQLQLHPWARMRNIYPVDIMELLGSYEKALSGSIACVEAVESVSLSEEGEFATRYFHYPAEKRRSRETVDEMRRAEQRLDALWAKIDERFDQVPALREIWEVVSDGRSLHRTPEWIESSSTQDAGRATPRRSSIESEDPPFVPFSHLHIGDSSGTSG